MLGLLGLVLCTVTVAAEGPDLTIPFEKYELANGLDVILAPDHSTPIVHVNIWYHVGSKDEEQGLTGFAHLFEHLMFQGSGNSPGEYFTPLQEIGGRINGTTNFDRTNYFETVPSHYLPLALFMESDRMGWLLPVLDQAKLDNQREVVRNERRQRYENPPYGEARKDLYAALFPKGHPYQHSTIGSHEDLENADLSDVKQFFETWYLPNNASLVICGDFDNSEAKALVEKFFGNIPEGEPPTHATADDVLLETTKEIRQYQDVPLQKMWMAWPSPRLFDDGDADLDILSSVLSSGKDSRLYKALVKEQRIAKDIFAYQASSMLGSAYIIQGTAAAGHTTDEMVEAIDAVLASVFGDAPPTQEEVDSAIANYEAGFYSTIQTISGKANRLNSYNMYFGDPDYMERDLSRYLATTIDSTVTSGQRILSAPRLTLHIWPESDQPKEETK